MGIDKKVVLGKKKMQREFFRGRETSAKTLSECTDGDDDYCRSGTTPAHSVAHPVKRRLIGDSLGMVLNPQTAIHYSIFYKRFYHGKIDSNHTT